jgi:hypothetical protein
VNRGFILSVGVSRLRNAVCLAFLCGISTVWSAVAPLVPLDASWRYLDDGSSQGTNWVGTDFDESGWSTGPAELGYGDDDEATVVDYGGNRNNKHITTYFRHSFIVVDPGAYLGLTLKVVRDDGVAVYLNGREVLRNNLPGGAITSSTLASADIEGAAEFALVSTNIMATLLTGGTNTIAGEIHQVARNSTDISFALELSATLNSPPSATLVSPTNGASFVAPANVNLAAAAIDADGPVSRVEFFEDTNLLGVATSTPFELSWPAVGPGAYQLSAVAVDAAGARGTSAVVNISVRSNLPPTVRIVEPTNNSVFIAPASVFILAEATDADGAVQRVEFYQGDALIGQSTNPPYALTTNLSAGNYQFRAVAVDDRGAHSMAAVVNVSVRDNALPVVTLTSPTNNSVFLSPVDIMLVATASDADGSITRVEFFANNLLLGETLNDPHIFVWTNAPIGTHTLRAVATDDRGSKATSAPVNIIVRDTIAPQVILDNPKDGEEFAAPADITISGSAIDADGVLGSIELFSSTNRIAELFKSPFSYVITNAAEGTYALYAVVTDDTGIRATSAVATVSVRVPRVLRGPYLQMGTTDGVTIRWRTDLPTDSVVRCGTNGAELTILSNKIAASTEHEIRFTGLSAGTRYFYEIGSSRQTLGGGADYSFVTSPNTPGAARIWVLGDSGTAGGAVQAVRDAYYAFNGTNQTDLWLMLGDNAYYTGTDSEYQAAVFDIFGDMLKQSVLWSTIGNHDFYSADQHGNFPYLDIFSLPTAGEAGGVASGTEKYYSFDFANIHFVCLDSMSVDRTSNAVMLAWLQQDLAANTNEWLIAFWHHPPYSKGSHDSDWEFELIEMREHALPILESYGVDLVLAGHSHSYERSFLLNGHYGPSDTLVPEMIKDNGDGRPDGSGAYAKPANEGAVFIVAGSSGWIFSGEFNHPVMYTSLLELGSLVLDVHGHVMDVKFLQDNGSIGDSFTMIKGPTTNVPATVSYAVTNEVLTLTWNSVPGSYYQVEISANLSSPDWIVSSPLIRATSGRATWSHSLSAVAGASFYRIVRVKEPGP